MRKKNNKFKLTLIIFFLTLTTILISLYNLVNSYNKNVGREKFIDFSISQEENFFQIEKYDILDDSSLNNKRLSELTKEDINKINNDVNIKGNNVYKIEKDKYVYKDIYELLNIRHDYGIAYDAYSYQSDNVDIINIDDKVLFSEKIIGNIPTKSNEILISNYVADLILEYGIKTLKNGIISNDYYKFDSYESLISENSYFVFDNKNVKISGIINYDLSKYEILKGKKWDELNNDEINLGDELIRKAKNIYSKVYVNQKFVDTFINNSEINEKYVITGVFYQVNFDNNFSLILKKYGNDENFSIKTTYSDDYYNILYLNTKLQTIFFYPCILCLIITIFLLLMFSKIFESNLKNKADLNLKIYIVVILITINLSFAFYSLIIILFKNVICSGFFQQLIPFEFKVNQYMIMFVFPVLMISLLKLYNDFSIYKKLK